MFAGMDERERDGRGQTQLPPSFSGLGSVTKVSGQKWLKLLYRSIVENFRLSCGKYKDYSLLGCSAM
jgi:hypothetical protein